MLGSPIHEKNLISFSRSNFSSPQYSIKNSLSSSHSQLSSIDIDSFGLAVSSSPLYVFGPIESYLLAPVESLVSSIFLSLMPELGLCFCFRRVLDSVKSSSRSSSGIGPTAIQALMAEPIILTS